MIIPVLRNLHNFVIFGKSNNGVRPENMQASFSKPLEASKPSGEAERVAASSYGGVNLDNSLDVIHRLQKQLESDYRRKNINREVLGELSFALRRAKTQFQQQSSQNTKTSFQQQITSVQAKQQYNILRNGQEDPKLSGLLEDYFAKLKGFTDSLNFADLKAEKTVASFQALEHSLFLLEDHQEQKTAGGKSVQALRVECREQTIKEDQGRLDQIMTSLNKLSYQTKLSHSQNEQKQKLQSEYYAWQKLVLESLNHPSLKTTEQENLEEKNPYLDLLPTIMAYAKGLSKEKQKEKMIRFYEGLYKDAIAKNEEQKVLQITQVLDILGAA